MVSNLDRNGLVKTCHDLIDKRIDRIVSILITVTRLQKRFQRKPAIWRVVYETSDLR